MSLFLATKACLAFGNSVADLIDILIGPKTSFLP